jgi:WD40 repeat protein
MQFPVYRFIIHHALHELHAENDITCLTCKSDSQHNFIAVCTSDGKTSLYDTDELHELCKIPTNQVYHNLDIIFTSVTPSSFQNAYAIHITQNETSFLFVSCDDTLQIWNGTFLVQFYDYFQ